MNGRFFSIATVACVFSMVGCASGSTESEDLSSTESAQTEATACDPARGVGAVNRFEKALHDSIAFAEGTEGRGGKDGYNVGYAYKLFASCARHPNVNTCAGSYCSTASGRYQFLTSTWNETARAINAPNFEPENQERGAQHLVLKVRKAIVPDNRALTATEFSNVMKKISWEWASLPPGRYGQPMKTEATMRADYCRNVTC